MKDEIDDEDTHLLLLHLHKLLLAKNGTLSEIAGKCETINEFRDLVNKWLSDTEVKVSEKDIKHAWKTRT